jgi:hypothetical protein
MEPEIQPQQPETSLNEAVETAVNETPTRQLRPPLAFPEPPEPWESRFVRTVFLGKDGLRSGWSVVLFALLVTLICGLIGFLFVHAHLLGKKEEFTPSTTFFGELIGFLGMIGAAAVVAFAERRRSLLAFNLNGPHGVRHFFSGLVAGFLSLSALMGALAWGGWLHFGPIALAGVDIFKFAAMWGAAFLLVGSVEEGIFRCYLQFTLTRGINFWWALGVNGAACLLLTVTGKGNGIWGVYLIAALGLIPCLILYLRKTPRSGFWQAAWVTSTLFGYIHTGNGGENWIGIFAAAAIGFVFCVSVRVTGTAWWAIGCHAAWDWTETYFYGAADSGNIATGHYLTTTPAGNVFWSGGTDGPEGSILVLGAILLMLVALIALYGRRKSAPELTLAAEPVAEQAAG